MKMKTMPSFLKVLKLYKDSITVIIAILILVVGGFQYFDIAVENRIKNSLEFLKRREGDTFVDARRVLIQKWIEHKGLQRKFSKTDVYTQELFDEAAKAIFNDAAYRTAIFNMSTFYTNAAACTLDGICDAPTMCASLMGEIQDYLDINRGYFIFARKIRKEDAISLTLSMPEFVKFCDDDISVRLFARHDRSLTCRIDLYLERLIGVHFGGFCKAKATEYDRELNKEADCLVIDASAR